jgi:hypothetical protein
MDMSQERKWKVWPRCAGANIGRAWRHEHPTREAAERGK